jgi:hypothetical protein
MPIPFDSHQLGRVAALGLAHTPAVENDLVTRLPVEVAALAYRDCKTMPGTLGKRRTTGD